MTTTHHRRFLATASALAVSAAGLAALAPAATAAPVDAQFTCDVSIIKNVVFDVTVDLALPTGATQGKPADIGVAAVVTAPGTVRYSAYTSLGGRFVSGPASIQAKVGSQAVTWDASVARTAISGTFGDKLVLDVAGRSTLVPAGAGAQAVTVTGFTADLQLEKADGSTTSAEATCRAVEPAPVLGTLQVAPAPVPAPEKPAPAPAVVASKVTAKVKVAKKSRKATVSTTVKAGKKAARGKVRITVKRGKTKVKSVTVDLNRKGAAKKSFTKLKKGRYTATVSFRGNSTTKKSSKVVRFRVK